MSEKSKILVSGARGFVGRNICEHLERQGIKGVFSPANTELELLDRDAVKRYLAENDIGLVIHCASTGGSRKTCYDRVGSDIVGDNLQMFLNIIENLPKDARMIHMGSGAEYSRDHWNPMMGEDYFGAHIPKDQYGLAKYKISKLVEKLDNVRVLRIFGLYGRYEDYSFKFISNSCVKSILGLPIVINQDVAFSYLYIDDFMKIIDRLIEVWPSQKFFNTTPDETITLRRAAEYVNLAAGHESEIKVLNGGMNREYSGDNSLLKKELGDFEFTQYDVGIKKLYEYYLSIRDEIDEELIREDPYLKNCIKR